MWTSRKRWNFCLPPWIILEHIGPTLSASVCGPQLLQKQAIIMNKTERWWIPLDFSIYCQRRVPSDTRPETCPPAGENQPPGDGASSELWLSCCIVLAIPRDSPKWSSITAVVFTLSLTSAPQHCQHCVLPAHSSFSLQLLWGKRNTFSPMKQGINYSLVGYYFWAITTWQLYVNTFLIKLYIFLCLTQKVMYIIPYTRTQHKQHQGFLRINRSLEVWDWKQAIP